MHRSRPRQCDGISNCLSNAISFSRRCEPLTWLSHERRLGLHLLRVAQRTSSCSSRISTNCTFGSPLVTRQATGERPQLAFSRGRILLRAVLLSLLRNCIHVKARRIPEARARRTLDETHLASREFQLRISDSVKSTSFLSLYLSIYLPPSSSLSSLRFLFISLSPFISPFPSFLSLFSFLPLHPSFISPFLVLSLSTYLPICLSCPIKIPREDQPVYSFPSPRWETSMKSILDLELSGDARRRLV